MNVFNTTHVNTFIETNVPFLLVVPALIIIAITALIRANDLGLLRKQPDGTTLKPDWHKWLRGFGLLLVGVTALSMLVRPLWGFIPTMPMTRFLMLWGFAITWFTTPGMPPWWVMVTTGRWRTPKEDL